MEIRSYTVSELNREIKIYLEENFDFSNFYLTGEASGVTYHKSGHLYFNLKDKGGVVKCVSFSYKMKRIPEDIKEGEVLKIFGRLTVYETGGNYQVLVDYVEKQNKKGNLFEQFEKLKKKLAAEGYFDEEHKKQLPFLPLNIGVVTAETGAAVRDIINTAKKRFDNINIYLYPARVQGEGAEDEIIQGIEFLENLDMIDLIIIGRGGGSIEDLWCFNSEKLAKTVFQCKKPVISAVGHEIDFVITDFVADMRAATPTQAIESSVPEKRVLKELLETRERKLNFALGKLIEIKRRELENLSESYILRSFPGTINEKRQNLIDMEEELKAAANKVLEEKRDSLAEKIERVKNLNPLEIIKRGYSVTKGKGTIIKSVGNIEIGERLTTIVADGEIDSIVSERRKI